MKQLHSALIQKLLVSHNLELLFSASFQNQYSFSQLPIKLGRFVHQPRQTINVAWYCSESQLVLQLSYGSFEKTKYYPQTIPILNSLESVAKQQAKSLNLRFRNIRLISKPFVNYSKILELKQSKNN